ncbi:hypothetical protein Q4525_12260 [Shimia thalassica]|uniref:hypothetical protein n=1 Tax=Shimia thalassica TaxID=1715693 RepID=UPI001C0A43AA|nr:hypothetical protein [Shimia thalassica]MBU2944196.1 hypothetical protein [Shimia thalassica]MDO6503709.1 hypothetical protein [Shimia thalassica]
MSFFTRFASGFAVTCALFAAAPALSQGADGAGLSPSQTARVVSILDTGFTSCASAAPVYRLDCFSQVYRNGSKLLANNASYWEAEVALTRVGRNLYTFVRANTDAKAGRIRLEGFRLKAVSEAKMPEAEKLYATNIARAIVLLSGGGEAEETFFGPIADEVAKYPKLIP